MIKIGLISLGCAKNLVDSEIVLGMLKTSGFEVVNSVSESDIVIINTCGFIEASKQESIETILEVAKENKKVIVIGCLVQRYLDELKESIPEVALWCKISDYGQLNEKIRELTGVDNVERFNPFVRLLSTQPFTAYLRISEGCNNCCTYCAIPLIRGKFRSRPLSDLVIEAKMLAQNNIQELVLISQDTTRYGEDLENTNIVTLLKELVNIKEFKSIRLLYLYPDEISDELIDFIKDNPVVAPYFDIPLQHSSDSILKAMNRRGTNESYKELINKIRNKIPNSVLRTTLIVGFPGETVYDFENLKEFISYANFDHLGVFKYSKEDGTKSFDYPDQIPDIIKENRYDEIMSIQRKISYKMTKKQVGNVMYGFVTGYNPNNMTYELRSDWNAPDDIDGKILFISKSPLKIGDYVKVKITSNFVYDLYGEMIE